MRLEPSNIQQIGDELAIAWNDGTESFLKLAPQMNTDFHGLQKPEINLFVSVFHPCESVAKQRIEG